MMIVCIIMDNQEKMELKEEIKRHTKRRNQIAHFHRGQILELASLKFETVTNKFEMQQNWMGRLKMI